MSKKSSGCEPELNQSCCGPNGAADVEEIVKKSYGHLWETLRDRQTQLAKPQSLPSAHDALLKELNPQKRNESA